MSITCGQSTMSLVPSLIGHRLYIVVSRENFGQTTLLKLLKLLCWTNVGPMAARQHCRVANSSNYYRKLAHRLIAIRHIILKLATGRSVDQVCLTPLLKCCQTVLWLLVESG